MSSDLSVLEHVDTTPALRPADPGDHERFAHYVRKEQIAAAAVDGKPAVALCGKKWVPVRDPSRFPVCPECQKVMDGIKAREQGDAPG